MSAILKNKPLVEAIFEVRWALKEKEPKIKVDPHYKILVGSLYDRLKKNYPYHEQLPTAEMPDEIAAYITQHRFRVAENKWPLIQVGPGIITANETEEYDWSIFEKSIQQAVSVLFDAYPEADQNLNVNSTLLRYIDSVPFDFEKDDILSFLAKQMNTKITLCPELFEGTPVKKEPLALNLVFSFNFEKPKSVIHLRFVRGRKNDVESLFWETMIQSTPEDTPKDPEGICSWVKTVHDITDDWFFKIIKGDLLESFN